MYVLKEEGMYVPLKVFSTEGSMEDSAIQQMKNISSLPFAYHHTAIMPDGHLGYGAAIGAVAALKGYVSAAIVGVDIGCGMCAVKTHRKNISERDLKFILGIVRKTIPVGFNHHKVAQDRSLMPTLFQKDGVDIGFGALTGKNVPVVTREYDSALKQLGTLGGGNHFIEVQKGSDGYVWIMIHSGSRNIGLRVAKHYNNIAVDLNEKWHAVVPKKWQLAFLPLDSDEGKAYMSEMQYCVDFALANRKLMMQRVQEAFVDVDQNMMFDDMINIAHNYASIENHYGQNVLVHRKGATQAKEGQLGIIPGSQGSKSYIVKGKGNKESFMSCSHGAGRKMGRGEAKRKLDLKIEQKKMKGILHSVRHKDDLDEAPGAYKDIDVVMENQKDLVDIVVELSPLAVVKG